MQSDWRCGRIVCTALCVLSALHLAGADAAPERPDLFHGHVIDIGGGRRMNIVCMGHGAPAVVFEYGLGGHMLNWDKVSAPISAFTTACFYDRAGYGFSDPSPLPMTAQNVTDDLHALLTKAGVRTPIVLVGHSLGGLYATLYADRFPSDVAGLLLIDPSFAGQDVDETPVEMQRAAAVYAQSRAWITRCGDQARRPATGTSAGCAAAPATTTAGTSYLSAQLAKAARWDAMLSESWNLHVPGTLSEDEQEEQAAAISFGSKPLIVFTAGIAPRQPDETDEEHGKNMAHWKAGHDRLAARSSRGESILVSNATHMIQLDQPQVVVDAIEKIVVTVRKGA